MVEEAQIGGRIIINVGNGYYEPDLSDPVEELEYRHYIMAKKSRIRKMAQTIHEMEMTAENQLVGQISLHDEKLPEEDAELEVMSGRFGPYLKYKGANYKLPKSVKDPTELTYEACMEIVNAPKPEGKKKGKKA